MLHPSRGDRPLDPRTPTQFLNPTRTNLLARTYVRAREGESAPAAGSRCAGSARVVQLVEPVARVERRDLVGVTESRHVEDGVHEVVDVEVARDHRLTEVNELGRGCAQDVDAQYVSGLGVDEQFEQSGAVAGDLATGKLAAACEAGDVRDPPLGHLAPP